MSDGSSGAGARLDALRADRRRRLAAAVAGAAVGLAVAWLHWLGFVLGGALVALAQPSFRRGVLAGLAFGLVAWLAFLAWLASLGALALYPETGQVLAVSTAVPFAGGALGSLARGLR